MKGKLKNPMMKQNPPNEMIAIAIAPIPNKNLTKFINKLACEEVPINQSIVILVTGKLNVVESVSQVFKWISIIVFKFKVEPFDRR